MKNIILLILLFSISVNSQKVQQVEVVKNDNQISDLFEELGQNEIKLDLIDILSLPAFDITYERIKDPYSSFGVSLFLNVGDNDSASRNWTDKFSLAPFYRFYFFNKKFLISEIKKLSLLLIILLIGAYIFKNHDDFPYYHLTYALNLSENGYAVGLGNFSHGR